MYQKGLNIDSKGLKIVYFLLQEAVIYHDYKTSRTYGFIWNNSEWSSAIEFSLVFTNLSLDLRSRAAKEKMPYEWISALVVVWDFDKHGLDGGKIWRELASSTCRDFCSQSTSVSISSCLAACLQDCPRIVHLLARQHIATKFLWGNTLPPWSFLPHYFFSLSCSSVCLVQSGI